MMEKETGPGRPEGQPEQLALAVEDRRREVARLYLARWTQREIARELGVSQTLVCFDIQAIREEYRTERQEMIEREVASLEAVEREVCDRYDEDRNPEWLDKRLKCMERRAKLLGLDAPKKVDATSGGLPFKAFVGVDVDKV
jgi:hypothetical protein